MLFAFHFTLVHCLWFFSSRIQSYPSHSLSRVRAHAVFQHTFNLWSRVVNLDFVEEKDYYKPADIVIRFGAGKHGDSIPFDGAGQ